MKKILAFNLFLCATILTVKALTLQWDANPASDQVTKYNVYQDAIQAPIATVTGTPPATTFVLPTLTPGPHTFSVTAVNLSGESTHSNVVTVPGLPGAPQNVRITP